MEVKKTLHAYWNAFAKNLDADPFGIDIVWEWIESGYCESNRCYHTLEHIDHCLYEWDWFRGNLHKDSSDAIELAIWFHDIVYNTKASNNEEESAKLARNAIGVLGLADPLLSGKVVRLINCTKHTVQDVQITEEEDLFLDIDLSILGAEPLVFDKYEANIRKEYEWVPLEIYCTKRVEILQSFLDRTFIFKTNAMRYSYEKTARENISRSIEDLKNK